MNKIRVWYVGKRIGCPYGEFSLETHRVFVSEHQVTIIPKSPNGITTAIDNEFVEKVEVL